jgi:FMN reductase
VEQALQAIEAAELLVVAAPVYRAVSGLFKHPVDHRTGGAGGYAGTAGSDRWQRAPCAGDRPPAATVVQFPAGAHVADRGGGARSPTSTASTSTVQFLQARIMLATERAAGHPATQALAVAQPLRRIAWTP